MTSSKYLTILEEILKENEIENEDLIESFLADAYRDSNKEEAIDRFFIESKSDNPFKDGYTYYDLIKCYEDVIDEKDD